MPKTQSIQGGGKFIRDDISQRSALKNSFGARKPSSKLSSNNLTMVNFATDQSPVTNLHLTGQPALLSVVPENPTFGATEKKGKDLSNLNLGGHYL